MCDILNSPCKVCHTDLPLHLGDYETSPQEVECYCQDHLPDKDCRIFTLKEEDDEFPKGWKMGIRSLTDNARKNKDMNFPNVGADWEEVDV